MLLITTWNGRVQHNCRRKYFVWYYSVHTLNVWGMCCYLRWSWVRHVLIFHVYNDGRWIFNISRLHWFVIWDQLNSSFCCIWTDTCNHFVNSTDDNFSVNCGDKRLTLFGKMCMLWRELTERNGVCVCVCGLNGNAILPILFECVELVGARRHRYCGLRAI